jgi:zinc transporter ZupT
MPAFLATCLLATAIAVFSMYSSGPGRLRGRLLSWTGGVLLGIGSFWIVPEMAAERGWLPSLIAVAAVLAVLLSIDRYVYPICPFCAAGVHQHGDTHRHAAHLGWPLLVVGCVHSFMDGWAIAHSRAGAPAFSTALSWGATLHKIPESVAVGLLSSRLASSRPRALGIVAAIQVSMLLGGFMAIFFGRVEGQWIGVSDVAACAFVLFFGTLALQEDWRVQGVAPAIRAAVPGLTVSGLAAIATHLLAR